MKKLIILFLFFSSFISFAQYAPATNVSITEDNINGVSGIVFSWSSAAGSQRAQLFINGVSYQVPNITYTGLVDMITSTSSSSSYLTDCTIWDTIGVGPFFVGQIIQCTINIYYTVPISNAAMSTITVPYTVQGIATCVNAPILQLTKKKRK